MKRSRLALFQSLISLLLCCSMLIGTTFAWFTDTVSSTNNRIAAGTLDVELEYLNENGTWKTVDGSTEVLDKEALWEPGYTEVAYLKVTNAGNLALKYALGVGVISETGSINVAGEDFYLSDHIRFGVIESETETTYATREEARSALPTSSLIIDGPVSTKNVLNEKDDVRYVTLVVYMPEDVGNAANYATGVTPPEINLGIELVATQAEYESDSFGSNYDAAATLAAFNFPEERIACSTSAGVESDKDNNSTSGVTLTDEQASAEIPAGVKLDAGTSVLTLEVTTMDESDANITLGKNDAVRSLDVHVKGIAKDNTVPMAITIKKAAPVGLNLGNYTFYHVENGETNAMEYVSSEAAFTKHNQFKYDPATGDITLYMATFSEVAMVADTVNAWNGDIDYSWYVGRSADYTIANADQMAGLNKIVSGAQEIGKDSFEGKTVKLITDINFEGSTWYPVGYWKEGNAVATAALDDAPEATYIIEEDTRTPGSTVDVEGTNEWYTYGGAFKGTFDGAGHTIANIYQNTWQMKGNYDGNYWNAAMGLFGYVNGGTVKNLTVENFQSDGEFTPTGVIAAYAANSTFENIAITNCNPRVYNTGNGGIVGIGGNTGDPDTYKLTFNNITIDNTNTISALWGSWDVACGGLVGMFRGAGHVHMTNCHVAAQIDVFNDVCGNYQYYWYRYAGMMVGTNKNMITDANGYTVPETSKFHAKNCTVHFGEWNDYYYCELVANSLASYTHDHQFSRLEQIQNVSEIQDASGNWNKTGNFIVMNGKIPTDICYHIVKNSDGTLKRHQHDDAGEETVNGKTVLKEDNQRIYLPFNQLFTGYGWGVKHIPVYNGEDYAFEGITILDREEAKSVKKFKGKVSQLANGAAIKLGDIFNFVDNGVELVPDALTVAVTNLDNNNPVSAEFVRDSENWENGTIEFTGVGKIWLTIQDYYFCTPTTIEVEIIDRQPEQKFATKFTGDFLYRVGNANTVALGSLFDVVKNEDDTPKYTIDSSKVGVAIEAQNGTGVSGSFTKNTSDWTKGTIKFSGTGIVKVTITDNDYCVPTELTLEVINAKNLTSAEGTTTGGTFVLVSDVNASSYVNYWNCTVYGNGFTYSLKGAPTSYNSKQGHGILIAQNAVFDNLVIKGDVYPQYGAYSNQDYYNTAIDATNTVIQNCHISNCAAPVRAKGVTINNTTLYGGTVANLIVMDGVNTLENVTTVNYNDGERGVLGFGVVIHKEATEYAKLVLNGQFMQHNFVCETDASLIADSNARELFNEMFNDQYSAYHFGTNPRFVNPGIMSMTGTFDDGDIVDNTGNSYGGKIISYKLANQTYDGYLYTLKATDGSVNNDYAESDQMQGYYPPTPSFDLGTQAVNGEDRYLKGDINGVEARYVQGEKAFALDIDQLMTVTKYGIPLSVSAKCKDAKGNEYEGVVSLITAGDYTLEFTVTDNLLYDKEGQLTGTSVERIYSVPLTVIVAEPAIKDAVITVNETALNGEYNESIGDRSYKFNPLNAITITDAEGTVNLTTNIASTNIVYASSSSAFAGATTITVTYNDGRVLEIKLGKPSVNSPGSSKAITYANDGTIKSAAKVASKSATGGTWTVTSYSFKGTNGKTVTNNTVVTFTFPDKSCVTGDTLVMLADGTQKRIDEVTYNDQLLVWNFFEGKYDVVPSAIIFYHGDDNYRVLQLNFSDGTKVKVLNNHGFFDVAENGFVFIDEDNVDEYIGHKFVKVNGNGTKKVRLTGYETYDEYTGCYSIQTAMHNNFMVEGMFSLTIPEYEGWFDYFEIGTGMKYDEVKMQADIEKYGLYDYSEFAEYVTYEQFIAFNGPYLKVLVGRGVVTFEQILELIETYVN